MFKRCHSLKKSRINLRGYTNNKSIMQQNVPFQNKEFNKQNFLSQSNINTNITCYTAASVSSYTVKNAELVKSIEGDWEREEEQIQTKYERQGREERDGTWKDEKRMKRGLGNFCQSVIDRDRNKIKQSQRERDGLMDEQRKLQRVKQMCKDIDIIGQKIVMYKEIMRKKQAQHKQNKLIKIEDKEKTVGLLIQLFQRQKLVNERIKTQLSQMGVKQLEEASSSLKQMRIDRRTTATFNYY